MECRCLFRFKPGSSTIDTEWYAGLHVHIRYDASINIKLLCNESVASIKTLLDEFDISVYAFTTSFELHNIRRCKDCCAVKIR